jgi:hypothetical protein
MLNVVVLYICDPTKYYSIFKQANEGGERDSDVGLIGWSLNK